MKDLKKVKEFYDSLAKIYDDLYGEEQKKKYEVASQALKGRKGFLLDLGCGTGEFSLLMEKAGWDVVGSDISVKMLKASESKGLRNLVQCSFDRPPFRPKSFDSISAITVFSNSEELLKVANCLRELLKPGGLLIASMPEKGYKSGKLIRYKGVKDVFLFLRS